MSAPRPPVRPRAPVAGHTPATSNKHIHYHSHTPLSYSLPLHSHSLTHFYKSKEPARRTMDQLGSIVAPRLRDNAHSW
eukprot:scaffold12229_cov112-Isochrysis_galbana.AAC.3